MTAAGRFKCTFQMIKNLVVVVVVVVVVVAVVAVVVVVHEQMTHNVE